MLYPLCFCISKFHGDVSFYIVLSKDISGTLSVRPCVLSYSFLGHCAHHSSHCLQGIFQITEDPISLTQAVQTPVRFCGETLSWPKNNNMRILIKPCSTMPVSALQSFPGREVASLWVGKVAVSCCGLASWFLSSSVFLWAAVMVRNLCRGGTAPPTESPKVQQGRVWGLQAKVEKVKVTISISNMSHILQRTPQALNIQTL